MNSIYSPESLSKIMIDSSGNNGDLLQSVSISRNNRNSSIYVELSGNGRVIPTIYRGYFDDDNVLTYNKKTYDQFILPHSTEQFIFDYDEHNDFNYINYYIVFECLYDDIEIDVYNIGVIFKDFQVTQNGIKSYGVSLVSDINNKALSKQNYYNKQSYSILCNATEMEEVLNIIDKPYYVVNVINGCLDNSSKLLIESGISRSYVTTATKMIELTIQNIVGK